MNTTQTIRDLLATLTEEAQKIHKASAQGKLERDDAITTGRALTELIKMANSALEPIKTTLRKIAVEQAKGNPGPQNFEAPDGTKCVVVIPKPFVSIRKSASWAAIRASLGDRFGQYFTEHTVCSPRKNFHQTVKENPAEAGIALYAVDLTEGTPRVSFRD